MILSGKVAIVTGGGRGIGQAAALRYAEEGAAVMVADRNGEAAEATAKQINEAGGRAKSFAADLLDPKGAEQMVAATLKNFGGLDCAFNNVGGTVPQAERMVHEIAPEHWHANIRINLDITFFCMRAELPHMVEKKRGAIVNVSSMSGFVASLRNPGAMAGKHGVIGLTKAAALDYGPYNIRVNVIAPGAIETPGLLENFSGDNNWRETLSHAPLARVGQPIEVANLAVWLSSDQASFVNGAAIPVDGGALASGPRVGVVRRS